MNISVSPVSKYVPLLWFWRPAVMQLPPSVGFHQARDWRENTLGPVSTPAITIIYPHFFSFFNSSQLHQAVSSRLNQTWSRTAGTAADNRVSFHKKTKTKRNKKQGAPTFILRGRAATEHIESETVDRVKRARRSASETLPVGGSVGSKTKRTKHTFYSCRYSPVAVSGKQRQWQCGGQKWRRCFSWWQLIGPL